MENLNQFRPEVNSQRWLDVSDLPNEIWHDIQGYEDVYQVSCYGRIKSLQRTKRGGCFVYPAKIIKLYLGKAPKNNYYIVVLQKGSDQRWVTAIDQLTCIKAFIDSFPEEPGCEVNFTTKSEDLEEEIERWIKEKHFIFTEIDEIIETARHFAEWQKKKDQETIELAEDHAMLAGMNRMKEEMMKNIVLETKVMMDCDGDGIETPYKEWLTLENTEIPYIPDNLGLKEGDRVKIIIVKEE